MPQLDFSIFPSLFLTTAVVYISMIYLCENISLNALALSIDIKNTIKRIGLLYNKVNTNYTQANKKFISCEILFLLTIIAVAAAAAAAATIAAQSHNPKEKAIADAIEQVKNTRPKTPHDYVREYLQGIEAKGPYDPVKVDVYSLDLQQYLLYTRFSDVTFLNDNAFSSGSLNRSFLDYIFIYEGELPQRFKEENAAAACRMFAAIHRYDSLNYDPLHNWYTDRQLSSTLTQIYVKQIQLLPELRGTDYHVEFDYRLFERATDQKWYFNAIEHFESFSVLLYNLLDLLSDITLSSYAFAIVGLFKGGAIIRYFYYERQL
jgi:hypothetical protein